MNSKKVMQAFVIAILLHAKEMLVILTYKYVSELRIGAANLRKNEKARLDKNRCRPAGLGGGLSYGTQGTGTEADGAEAA